MVPPEPTRVALEAETEGPVMSRGTRTAAIATGVGGVLIAIQLGGAAAASAATLPAVLSAIKQCESSGNYTAVNPSSGASGAYQFLTSTWQSLSASAGYATAAAAPPAVQDAAALELYNEDGTAPWVSSESCWGPLVANESTSLTPASVATPSVSPSPARTFSPVPGRPAFALGRPATDPGVGGNHPCPGGRPGPRP
jgi:hypothetical protein